jgi:SAM-dependent methyltransferase
MAVSLSQHQNEIQRNLRVWETKPLLREIYAAFYQRIQALVDPRLPGRIVELGSGIGNLKRRLPSVISTDLFVNPWLDLVCDGYELPFGDGTVSHLVLFDVFHHLQFPNAFMREARRALVPSGRLILFEPYISWASALAYGLFHHEPLGWHTPVDFGSSLPPQRDYYAAQANATRLFFHKEFPAWPHGWTLFHAEALAAFGYLLSGGFSRPALYPACWLPWLRRLDTRLSRWPRMFGARCLVGLRPA